jgi:hypothetical protein
VDYPGIETHETLAWFTISWWWLMEANGEWWTVQTVQRSLRCGDHVLDIAPYMKTLAPRPTVDNSTRYFPRCSMGTAQDKKWFEGSQRHKLGLRMFAAYGWKYRIIHTVYRGPKRSNTMHLC